MTDSPIHYRAEALDDDQRAYEALFGLVPEWHAADAAPEDQPADVDDDDLYRALFGA